MMAGAPLPPTHPPATTKQAATIVLDVCVVVCQWKAAVLSERGLSVCEWRRWFQSVRGGWEVHAVAPPCGGYRGSNSMSVI